jgi:ribonuclease R
MVSLQSYEKILCTFAEYMRKKQPGRSGKKGQKQTHKIKTQSTSVTYRGTISMAREGYGFLLVDVPQGQDPIEDVFIPAGKLNGALHADKVQVDVRAAGGRGRGKQEGRVVAVMERSPRPYVGILQIVDKKAYVITDSRNMPYDIRVQTGMTGKARNGQKVAVLVTEWNRRGNFPEGRIVDILGMPGLNQTEMHAILAEFGLPYRFDKKVAEEAEALSDTFPADALKGRRDFRNIPTFTIDPADAKDFDDALSYRKTGPEGTHMEIGVHIADVSYYVDAGTLLDKAAYERGCSVYLPDRTVPMFPEKLSNFLCSLRPREDKLCVSAVFELDENFRILTRWFGRTVIRSRCRLSYEQAQSVLDAAGRDGIIPENGKQQPARQHNEEPAIAKTEYILPEGLDNQVREALIALNKVATRLREERVRRGAVTFDKAEVHIQVDDEGVPVSIGIKEQLEAHSLIEELMLLANREVAEYVNGKKDKKTGRPPAFVYRIHEEPDADKIAAFRNFVYHFGYSMGKTESPRAYAREVNKLLEKAKEKTEAGGIVIMALRSMPRARYTTKNVGHYGLAFDTYTHFTSPIRRYPDLMTHRLLLHYLSGGRESGTEQMEAQCVYLSEREQLATEAERAGIKYKMVEFMQDKIGRQFSGVITGLTEWGMFVELDDTMIEGMVSVRDMTDDYYVYDKESMTLTGTHSGIHFALGQKVRIAVARANLEQKQLDFDLIQ